MFARTDRVKRRVLLFLLLQVAPSLSITVNIRPHVRKIVAKHKIQLAPVHIPCFLNDVVRLSAPVIHENDVYYLSKPNGEETKLNLHAPKELNINKTKYYRYGAIATSFIRDTTGVVKTDDSFHVFKAANFEQKTRDLEPNEFLVGPLQEEDYGNWVLSVYTTTLDGEWVEMYQVLTMAIVEYIKLHPRKPKIRSGDTFTLSFAYPLLHIESCEVVAPRSTYDRFFNRTLDEYDKCGFSIPNITKRDEGSWQIIGFGKIVYQGDVHLTVLEDAPNSTSTTAKAIKEHNTDKTESTLGSRGPRIKTSLSPRKPIRSRRYPFVLYAD